MNSHSILTFFFSPRFRHILASFFFHHCSSRFGGLAQGGFKPAWQAPILTDGESSMWPAAPGWLCTALPPMCLPKLLGAHHCGLCAGWERCCPRPRPGPNPINPRRAVSCHLGASALLDLNLTAPLLFNNSKKNRAILKQPPKILGFQAQNFQVCLRVSPSKPHFQNIFFCLFIQNIPVSAPRAPPPTKPLGTLTHNLAAGIYFQSLEPMPQIPNVDPPNPPFEQLKLVKLNQYNLLCI